MAILDKLFPPEPAAAKGPRLATRMAVGAEDEATAGSQVTSHAHALPEASFCVNTAVPFHADCLEPAFGPGRYGALTTKLHMDEMCEAYFWGGGSGGGAVPGASTECFARAAAVVAAGVDALSPCAALLGLYAFAAAYDFAATCAHHASRAPPLSRIATTAASGEAPSRPHRAAQVAGAPPVARTQVPPLGALSTVARGLVQRTVSADEVQPTSRDTVHAVWLNGPTYASKIRGGRLSNGNWPKFGTTEPDPAYTLILRGKGG